MIKPLSDYVLLEKVPSEKKVGSIILTSEKKTGNVATVVAISENPLDKEGKKISLNVKVGDKVIYKEYSGTDYEENDKKYLLIKNEDIIAIIE
ncbi:MAG TPA: co-chaperone GroES [Firmicutes bacterium]|nr:co-chaperone GroES [Bacillota bacterium]HBX25644.1 co-chaperone GroES [Bacillota bacterium]